MRQAKRAGQGLGFSFLLALAGLFIISSTKKPMHSQSHFPFCKIAYVLVLMVKCILRNELSCKKSRFPFGKIAHLLAVMKDILISGITCKKVVFFFASLNI